MFHTLIFFFFIFSQVQCLNKNNLIPSLVNKDSEQQLEIGISYFYSIDYNKDKTYIFYIEDDKNYQINIHSIDCNYKIDFLGEILNKINLDTYSLKANKTSNKITIKPLIDIIGGEEKENYAQKKCHISINSINEDKPELNIDNNQDSFFYFKSENYNILNISYEIKQSSKNNFVALFFQLNERSNFSVDIYANNGINQTEPIFKNVYNSTYIFIKPEILENVLNNETNTNLNITIKKIDNNKDINMFFKIIEKETISMLQKNALNYGFMTTGTKYQYFYLEVFKKEEGELMLHDKRFYGLLLAKIVSKGDINYTDLYNSSNYLRQEEQEEEEEEEEEETDDENINIRNILEEEETEDENINILDYNPHSLKLTYSYTDTLNCDEGCYILITYVQSSEEYYLNIGYEFTLLSRSWNYSDYIPQIIDIPFNEYLLGSFEKNSITTHHYYSIQIPEEAEKIIIQIEGNFIDCFIGEGKKKINTMKIEASDKNLNIINNQNVITLNKTQFNFNNNNRISFAFRSKDYFDDIFSFYYFRILYVRNNEIIYFPLDSQFGNLCLPEKNNETNLFYCHFMLSNNYEELSTKFTISSSNQNEYFKIYIMKIYKNGIVDNETKDIFYMYNIETDDIDFIFLTFEFLNSEIKCIVNSLQENIDLYYPQIYSAKIFYTYEIIMTNSFRVNNNYVLKYKYLYTKGKNGGILYFDFYEIQSYFFSSDRNFLGKPFAIDINPNSTDLYLMGFNDWLFVLQLEYNRRGKGIIEIKPEETRSQIMESGVFPLNYYLKLKNENYININVNLRLKYLYDPTLVNNIDIKGYLLDEDTLSRKINGEYILLKNPIQGYYSNKFSLGLLEVNQEKKYNDNYLLIEIINLDTIQINSFFLVELVTKENSEDPYFMPISHYLIETFGDNNNNNSIRNINKYHIFTNQRGTDQVFIEISPEYNDIDLVFTNENNTNPNLNYSIKYEMGLKRYAIYSMDTDNIYFNVVNPKKRKASYMLRYFYSEEKAQLKYYLNVNADKKYIDENEENITLSLTYEPLEIFQNNKPLNTTILINISISGLLYKKKENSQELLNTTTLLYERNPSYEDHAVTIFNISQSYEFTLIFKNIPRKENFVYDLQFQFNAFIDYFFNELYFVFTTEVDLTDIILEEKKSILWYILGPILGIIVVLNITFFVIKYIRLRKANLNLKEDLKSMAYSNDIQKNVLSKQQKTSEKETDYDSTFI